MSDDIRPNFTIVRCCKNCQFFRYSTKDGTDRMKGACLLPKVANKKADFLKTHGTAICDAHVWKAHGKTLHKVIVQIGATPPEGTV